MWYTTRETSIGTAKAKLLACIHMPTPRATKLISSVGVMCFLSPRPVPPSPSPLPSPSLLLFLLHFLLISLCFVVVRSFVRAFLLACFLSPFVLSCPTCSLLFPSQLLARDSRVCACALAPRIYWTAARVFATSRAPGTLTQGCPYSLST